MARRASTGSEHHLELGPYELAKVAAAQAASSTDQSPDAANGWKHRAPYRARSPEEHFPVRYEAQCHCGEVKYQLSRERPLDVKFCHCTTCQTQHGAPFQWAAIFHKNDINFVHGAHHLEWYDPGTKSSDHKLPCKVRCSFCYSPIMDEGRNMLLLFPSLIKMSEKDRQFFKPRCHMFYGTRVVDINDGLPKWTGLSQHSELTGDTRPEYYAAFKKWKEEEAQRSERSTSNTS